MLTNLTTLLVNIVHPNSWPNSFSLTHLNTYTLQPSVLCINQTLINHDGDHQSHFANSLRLHSSLCNSISFPHQYSKLVHYWASFTFKFATTRVIPIYTFYSLYATTKTTTLSSSYKLNSREEEEEIIPSFKGSNCLPVDISLVFSSSSSSSIFNNFSGEPLTFR